MQKAEAPPEHLCTKENKKMKHYVHYRKGKHSGIIAVRQRRTTTYWDTEGYERADFILQFLGSKQKLLQMLFSIQSTNESQFQSELSVMQLIS